MIKKINQYLITHHPMLWNTKVVWVWPAILVLHLCFYIAGYLHFSNWDLLHRYARISSNYVESENGVFSGLVSFLLLVIWLVFYLRNNPFKSYYPLRRFYFISELTIILLTIIGGITFFKSYALGFTHAVRSQTAEVNLVDEINTFNLAVAFIPTADTHYKVRACCDTLNFIDSLQYEKAKIHDRYALANKADSVYYDEQYVLIDSALEMIEKRNENDNRYSLLYYCQKNYSGFDTLALTREEISAQVRAWLLSGNKTAVEQLLARFEAMCDRYVIERNFSIKPFAGYAFTDSSFTPTQFVNRDGNSTYRYRGNKKMDDPDFGIKRISLYDLERSLDNIHYVRKMGFQDEFWLVIAYVALGLSLLLYTFRLTPVKVWFIAFVAHIGLPIVIGLVALAVRNTEGILMFLLLLPVITYTTYLITIGKSKKIAGVCLVWLGWWLPFIGMVLYGLLYQIYQPVSVYNGKGGYVTQTNPVHDFLSERVLEISLVNFLIAFLVMGLLLARHFRRWYASNEE